MKKVFSLGTLYLLTFIIMIANVTAATVQSLNPDISSLPEGRLIDSVASPEGKSRIDVYLVSNNLGNAVRGVYVTGGRAANIYWQTGVDSAEIVWHSEQSITINNVPLNVKTDTYDSRRGTAIFSEGLLARDKNADD
ncbi:MAG: hypothetical protein IKZ47_00455 [Clostridia bacterium]|nr:hypothetical protein [Clostridia bacterium]